MDHLIGLVLSLGYTAAFLFLISRMRFFRIGNVPVKWFQGVFVLKVISGFFLYLIYTYYYTDRSTSDIWKYFDDGMILFSALRDHPMDYFQMLFGIGNDGPRFDAYYDQMSHWYRPYGSSIANDTHTIIRFNAFVRLFSLGHYNVHSVVVNFLGLIGLTGIFHFLREMKPAKEKWFFLGVFLMPGMMFWASGVLKEPLLLFGLGLFLFGVSKLALDGWSIGRTALVLLSLVFLFTVKSYALIAIIPGLIAWGICRRVTRIHPSIVFLSVYSLGAIGLVGMGKVIPEKDVLQRLAKRQYEFYQLAEGGTYVRTAANDTLYIGAENYGGLEFSSDRKILSLSEDLKAVHWEDAKQTDATELELTVGTELTVLLDYGKTGSAIDIPRLEPNAMSVVKAIPMALVNATFRPFPQHINSPFMLLSGLENLIIGLLLFLAIIGVFRGKPFPRNPIFYIAVAFALVILVLTGLVTPVVGAIVRYKVPALPFLVCALLAMIDTERIGRTVISRIPFLRMIFP